MQGDGHMARYVALRVAHAGPTMLNNIEKICQPTMCKHRRWSTTCYHINICYHAIQYLHTIETHTTEIPL